jgi:hypothetical protein
MDDSFQGWRPSSGAPGRRYRHHAFPQPHLECSRIAVPAQNSALLTRARQRGLIPEQRSDHIPAGWAAAASSALIHVRLIDSRLRSLTRPGKKRDPHAASVRIFVPKPAQTVGAAPTDSNSSKRKLFHERVPQHLGRSRGGPNLLTPIPHGRRFYLLVPSSLLFAENFETEEESIEV